VGRPQDQGYPIRGIVKEGLLYLHNFETSRWPAGNPETGYLNSDGSPTKTEVLKSRSDPVTEFYWRLSFAKRPQEELYDIVEDPDCSTNLSELEEYQQQKALLKKELFDTLTAQEDPRILGNGQIFDEYIYADEKHRNFYDRFMAGEEIQAGWVNSSDFEESPLD
jgi:hypothetical protein